MRTRFRLNSLRNRFLLLIAVVLALTGILTTWFASRVIYQRFENYLAYEIAAGVTHRQQLQEILPPLCESSYAQAGSLDAPARLVQQFGDLTGERVVLLDPGGAVVADSAHALAGQPEPAQLDSLQIPLSLANQPIGTLLIAPVISPQPSASQQEFIASMNWALFGAVASAGVVALLLTLALARGILRPVEALTVAVNRMKSGDLKQRVEVTSNDEIGELARAFNGMAEDLAQAEMLRRAMVSDVADELRTPLSNIRGYLEAMQDGVVQPTPETIDSLHEESLLLTRLVDDLQLLALADSGHLSLAPQPVDLADIVEKSVQAASHQVNGTGIQLQAQIVGDLPLVCADAERIGQVLRNLLNNAFTYTPHDGEITVSARQTGDQVEVSVFNTGRGIALEHLPHLFDRFYRVDRSRNRATGGSGLGLAIVRQLVVAHGGGVWAESKVGQWAKFSFTLPVCV